MRLLKHVETTLAGPTFVAVWQVKDGEESQVKRQLLTVPHPDPNWLLEVTRFEREELWCVIHEPPPRPTAPPTPAGKELGRRLLASGMRLAMRDGTVWRLSTALPGWRSSGEGVEVIVIIADGWLR
jgi:hypothetical protein